MSADMKSGLECCPYCGGEEFYRKGYMSGRYEYHYRFDGSPADNSHLHDSLDYRENKTRFCSNCDKRLPNVLQPSVNEE